jgi:uncharacterized phage protein (predicted DNA packaging)|nr:MAG: head-tail connector protein [Bacteriophage sp.]DAS60281.1 MAG TPA: head tail connector [Caudoviricetes sp.]
MAYTPPVVSLADMRDYLRLDNTANDGILADLIEAAAVYITQTTGMDTTDQADNPLARSAIKMLVATWYDPQGIDATASERAVTEMLKHLPASTGGGVNG